MQNYHCYYCCFIKYDEKLDFLLFNISTAKLGLIAAISLR